MYRKFIMRTAYAYIRFSSEKQSAGDSVRRQQSLIDSWVKNNPDYMLSQKTYKDEGLSAFTGKHAAGDLGRLMNDISNGSITAGDVILIESLDRLSRENISTATDRLKAILIHGVNVVTLTDQKQYNPESLNSPMDLIMSILTAQRAHEESQSKSKRMREVWAKKRTEAEESGKVITKSCPRWLTVNSDRTGFEPIPEHVESIRLMFEMRLSGKGFAGIAQALNESGRLTLTGRSKGWNQSSVQQLLSNKALIGYKIPSRKAVVNYIEIPDYFPSVIPLEQFQQVQLIGADKQGQRAANDRPMNVNLFRGVMKCAECGATVIVSGVDDKRAGYYSCSFRRLGRCNTSKPMNRGMVDEALIKGLLYSLDRLTTQGQGENPLMKLEAKRADLTERSQKLLAALEIADDVSAIATRLKAVTDEIRAIDTQIKTCKDLEQVHTVQSVQGMDLTVKSQREEVQLLVKKTFREISLDGIRKTVNVYLHNGLTLLNVPVNQIVDAGEWIELLPVIGGDTVDFRDINFKAPRYLD